MNVTKIYDTNMQARLAQSVERETLNLNVVGSTPTLGGIFFAVLFHSCLFLYSFFCAITVSYHEDFFSFYLKKCNH